MGSNTSVAERDNKMRFFLVACQVDKSVRFRTVREAYAS